MQRLYKGTRIRTQNCCTLRSNTIFKCARKKKPFGQAVIETHRLLKNNIQSDNYVIISHQLSEELKMPFSYKSKLFTFIEGENITIIKR